MSARLIACDACHRHARVTENKCPFCGAAMPTRQPTRGTSAGRIGRAALIVAGAAGAAVGAASCGDVPVIIAGDAYGLPPPDAADVAHDSPIIIGDAYGLPFDSGPDVGSSDADAGDASADGQADASGD